MCIYLQDKKFLKSMLSMGQLYTDADINNANSYTANDNDDNNDTRRTNHDCIGSLACVLNELKTRGLVIMSNVIFEFNSDLKFVFASAIICKLRNTDVHYANYSCSQEQISTRLVMEAKCS